MCAMMIKVAIIDSRKSYLKRLVEAFESGYADRLQVFAFSNLGAFEEFLKNSSVDVMLVGEDLGDETLEGMRGAMLVYLVDDREVDSMYGHRVVCRFQKTDLIYRSILDACSDRFDHVSSRRAAIEGVNVISFFPASGGVGASSMAAACAIGAAKRGLRAFYLNLELFGMTAQYFVAPGAGGLEDVLMAIEAKKNNVAMRLQSVTKRSHSGVYFVDSVANALDLSELTPDHLDRLVREIAMSGTYDVVVLDMDFAHSKLALTAMELATRSVFVSNGSAASNLKFERLYQMLQSMGRMGMVEGLQNAVLAYNNFNSKTGKRLNGDVVPVAGGLPRIVDVNGNSLEGTQLAEALSVSVAPTASAMATAASLPDGTSSAFNAVSKSITSPS